MLLLCMSVKIGPEHWLLELEQGNHCGKVMGVKVVQKSGCSRFKRE